MRKNYDHLGEESFKKKAKFVYKGIDLNGNKFKVSHFSIFLLKRFVLIMIPTILRGRQGVQAMLLLHSSVLYGAYVVIIKPYLWNRRQRLELFNSFIFYFIALITYTFSDFNSNLETQIYLSFFLLGVIGLFVFSNMIYIFVDSYRMT